MTIVVVDQAVFGVVEFARPLDGLLYITAGAYFAVGGVGIGGAEVTGGAEDFADVFRQIPAVGEPCTVFTDGKGAGGDGLSRIPGEEPEARMAGAGEVATGYLQVAVVDVALMEGDGAVG